VSMNESLIFNGDQLSTPCFYDPGEPPPVPLDVNKLPDSYIQSPLDFPQNDPSTLAKTQQMSSNIIRPMAMPIAPGTCTANPPGFVCGPLPAPDGTLVKCVPRMDQSDLNQLSARVLPFTVSRANGSLDDPARPDPRFALFPNKYPAAFSRCCHGTLGDPLDIKPLTCEAQSIKSAVDRLVPSSHRVKAMDLGFRTNPDQIAQLKLTNKEELEQKLRFHHLGNNREKIWRLESRNIKTLSNPLWLPQKRSYQLNFL
jgi:hypothetical protein